MSGRIAVEQYRQRMLSISFEVKDYQRRNWSRDAVKFHILTVRSSEVMLIECVANIAQAIIHIVLYLHVHVMCTVEASSRRPQGRLPSAWNGLSDCRSNEQTQVSNCLGGSTGPLHVDFASAAFDVNKAHHPLPHRPVCLPRLSRSGRQRRGIHSMAFIFICGTHSAPFSPLSSHDDRANSATAFSSLLQGQEHITVQCQNCGNFSSKLLKRW